MGVTFIEKVHAMVAADWDVVSDPVFWYILGGLSLVVGVAIFLENNGAI